MTTLTATCLVAAAAIVACRAGGTQDPVSDHDPHPPGESAPNAPSPGGGGDPSDPGDPTAPNPGDPPEDPGPPRVQLVGRYDLTDPEAPKCGWPGCRVIARFEGTEVSVTLDEQPVNYGPSVWDFKIDDTWLPSVELVAGVSSYPIASGLPAGKHTVEIYKRTEGQNGVTRFRGFDFHGGTLLPPPLRAKRRIEILGDSDVSGFGYEGWSTGGVCNGPAEWAARFENYRLAWGQRLADFTHAELNGTVFSGKGFYYNIWRPDLDTIGVLFNRSNPVDEHSVWDTKKFVPHVVIIALGGNDYNIGQPEDFGPAPLDGFTQKVREVTDAVRAAYREAHIFLMAYAVLTDEYPPGRGRRTNVETALHTVQSALSAKGDTRVYYTAPAPSVAAELTGCGGHGGPEYHERIARFLESEIRAKTGWRD